MPRGNRCFKLIYSIMINFVQKVLLIGQVHIQFYSKQRQFMPSTVKPNCNQGHNPLCPVGWRHCNWPNRVVQLGGKQWKCGKVCIRNHRLLVAPTKMHMITFQSNLHPRSFIQSLICIIVWSIVCHCATFFVSFNTIPSQETELRCRIHKSCSSQE